MSVLSLVLAALTAVVLNVLKLFLKIPSGSTNELLPRTFLNLHLSYFLPLFLLPVGISHEEWCWKHKSLEVEVLDSDVLGVEFRQIGYILRCSLSHAITLVSMQPSEFC